MLWDPESPPLNVYTNTFRAFRPFSGAHPLSTDHITGVCTQRPKGSCLDVQTAVFTHLCTALQDVGQGEMGTRGRVASGQDQLTHDTVRGHSD